MIQYIFRIFFDFHAFFTRYFLNVFYESIDSENIFIKWDSKTTNCCKT